MASTLFDLEVCVVRLNAAYNAIRDCVANGNGKIFSLVLKTGSRILSRTKLRWECTLCKPEIVRWYAHKLKQFKAMPPVKENRSYGGRRNI